MTFTCCMTNGYGDYYPTDVAYDQGGYEPGCTRFVRGCGSKLVEGSDKLLKRMHDAK